MSNQNVVLPNASTGLASNQFSQRQSSRCNNLSNQYEHVVTQKAKSNVAAPVVNLSGSGNSTLKRENGLTFKALMNGVSPKNQQQNGNSFNHTKEKVFHSFQQNNQAQAASNPAELGAQGLLQNQNGLGSSIAGQTGSSMMMSMKKAQNGILPMVNSQQLMTANNAAMQPPQQRPVGLMAAKAHMQDPAIGQAGLAFGDNEYKNYPGPHQIQKQLINQSSVNTVVAGQSQYAHSAKLEKQIKADLKQQSMHYQANQVNGFSASTREAASNNGDGATKQQADDQANAQSNGLNSNNQRSTQRRKLLFEYGLEKNFSSSATANASGPFPQKSEQHAQGLAKQPTAANASNFKNLSGTAQIQAQRYGGQNSNHAGATKGSSLGHYQPLQANGGGNQTHQRTPEGISNVSGNSGILGSNPTVPHSASQQSQSLQSSAQPNFKQIDNGQTKNTHHTQEIARSANRNVQNEQQSSKATLQSTVQYIPGIAGSIPHNQLTNSIQRKQQYQNQASIHKNQNTVASLGLLEQLLMNLKAINIEKLEEKEQEQLRFLSNQYQFHLNQFQDYQKQQILSGNFESSIGLGTANNIGSNGSNQLNSSGKTQSTIRYNNNQSGFSGRLNDQVSISQSNTHTGAQSSGSGLGDIQGKSDLHMTEQKHSEGENMAQGHGHVKQQSASVTNNATGGFNNVYSSQERFVQNEKNLRDMRLKKSKMRNENTPGESVTAQESNGAKHFGSSGNNTGASANGAITSDLSAGSPFFQEGIKEQDTTKSSVLNGQTVPQVNSQKNLNRNVSYTNINEKTNLNDISAPSSSNKVESNLMGTPGPKTSTIGDLPFSFHLNLPHPVPQITSSDIKSLSANQRVAIFKHLQKREKSKFLGIQQNKMKTQEKQVQIKFTQQRFRSRQLGGQAIGGPLSNVFDKGSRDRGAYLQNDSRTSAITVGGSGTGARTGMSRFVSVGQRGQRDQNGRFNNIENDLASQAQFDKQMENLRRQWASDLRAFGIFQQNELWQFSQMNESQQKQILVCNLQQGKFQSLIDEQYEVLMQKQAQQAWINQRNTLLHRADNNAQITNRDPTQQDQQTKQSRRHTYGSALSSMAKDGSEQQEQETNINEGLPQKSSKQQSLRNSANFDQKNKGPEVCEGEAMADLEREMNETDDKRSNSPQKRQNNNKNLINTLNYHQKQPDGGEDLKSKDQDHFNTDREKTININFKDFEKRQPQKTNNQPDGERSSSTHQGLGIGIKDKYENNSTFEARNVLNPVQKRYEDSKDSFQECLRQILCKYQYQINLSQIQGNIIGHGSINDGQSQKKIGIENLLPNFTRNLMNRNNKDGMLNDMGGLKHRQSESAKNNIGNPGAKGNLNTITNDKYGYKAASKVKAAQEGKSCNKLKVNPKEDSKKKDQTIVAPNSTKSGAKKIGIDGKEQDEEAVEDEEPKEAIVEEVKKPRYFPPKRLPNPFESAAQEQERFIQARKDALLKYSNISKNRYKQDEKEPLKYVIRPGNNSKLISRVMEQSGRVEAKNDKNDGDVIIHPGWEPADDYYDSLYHFKWKPTSGGIKFDLIGKHGLKQVVNHVRGHGALTTKDNLFLNMKQFYESQKLNIFETVPITIVLDYLKDDIGQKVEQVQTIINIIDKNISSDSEVINKKLFEMQQQKEKNVKTPYKISRCCHNAQNLWLLKPTGFNRGIGIHLFQNFDQLRDIMCTHYGIGRGARDKTSIFQLHNQNHNPNSQQHPYADPNNKNEEKMKNFTFVIQKLVERPLLYFNRKFDIRQWVLLNAADGKVFIYKECYVRTSSREYVEYDPQLPEEDQIYMQLTNNAVQKVGVDYEKYEEGNIVSLHTLFEYIAGQPEAKGCSKETLETKYKQDVDKIITETFKSIKGQILCQKHTFELLGYDFILDEDLNTILIEVNTNPCLEESNELLRRLLPRMIDDTLNVVLDPVFIERGNEKYKSKFPLRPDIFSVEQNCLGKSSTGNLIKETTQHEGYKDDLNLWRHITTMD